MELGLLFFAIVVFSLWYDNLYEFVLTKYKNSHFGLSTAKGSIKNDGNCNIQHLFLLPYTRI